jgi:hypothetical protein
MFEGGFGLITRGRAGLSSVSASWVGQVRIMRRSNAAGASSFVSVSPSTLKQPRYCSSLATMEEEAV